MANPESRKTDSAYPSLSGPELILERVRRWAEKKVGQDVWTEPYEDGDRGYLVKESHERDCGLEVLEILNGREG